MHAHPMPAISLGILLRVRTIHDLYHWRSEAGELRTSVGFDAGGTSHAHLQGPPAALRELAAALIDAVTRPTRPPSRPLPWPRGWPADVGTKRDRGGRLPGVRVRLAHPLPLARPG
jgi:hypothetical protein